DQDAVDLRVDVQPVDHAEQPLVGCVARKHDAARVETGGVRRAPLHPDVDLTRRIVAHQDGGEAGAHAGLSLEARSLIGDLCAHRAAQFGPAEDPGHSSPSSTDGRVPQRAKSTARVSRITTTLICPGYWSSSSK